MADDQNMTETTPAISDFEAMQNLLKTERQLALMRAAETVLAQQFNEPDQGWNLACKHIAKMLREQAA